jgi:hypothetical protein
MTLEMMNSFILRWQNFSYYSHILTLHRNDFVIIKCLECTLQLAILMRIVTIGIALSPSARRVLDRYFIWFFLSYA